MSRLSYHLSTATCALISFLLFGAAVTNCCPRLEIWGSHQSRQRNGAEDSLGPASPPEWKLVLLIPMPPLDWYGTWKPLVIHWIRSCKCRIRECTSWTASSGCDAGHSWLSSVERVPRAIVRRAGTNIVSKPGTSLHFHGSYACLSTRNDALDPYRQSASAAKYTIYGLRLIRRKRGGNRPPECPCAIVTPPLPPRLGWKDVAPFAVEHDATLAITNPTQ